MDTVPEAYYTQSNVDKYPYHLVFSDEFEVSGRNFIDGSDPRWTAINKDDYTNFALQYYDENLATTNNGYLNISTIVKDVTFEVDDVVTSNIPYKKTKNYKSAMIQGWNKFCFTGGILEIRAKLPGYANIGGMWPAMWLLGNLARGTYVSSSNNMWPWSYDKCSKAKQAQQKISACNQVEHYDFEPFTGRGAPEIDLLEAMPGQDTLKETPVNKPYFSTSLQISPGLSDEDRPEVGTVPQFPPEDLDLLVDSQERGRLEAKIESFRGRLDLSKDKYLTSISDVEILQREKDEKEAALILKELEEMWSKVEKRLDMRLDQEISRLRQSKSSSLSEDKFSSHLSTLEQALAVNQYKTRRRTEILKSYSNWYREGLEYGHNSSLNIFFYGMHLAGVTHETSYSADALSANTNLTETHFDTFHTYRLEWQPGLRHDRDADEYSKGDDSHDTRVGSHPGYLVWYLDDEFLYKIDGSALTKTGAMIPEEPMYIILNTAISSTWGFPSPCPEACPYCKGDPATDCYDCRKFECSCSMPKDMCKNYPAAFLVDYVRVYQPDVYDAEAEEFLTPVPKPSKENYYNHRINQEEIGCSTPSHPTATYIRAHKRDYMKKGDVVPLKNLNRGGGTCSMHGNNRLSTKSGENKPKSDLNTENNIEVYLENERELTIPGLTGDDDANDDGVSTGVVSGTSSRKDQYTVKNPYHGSEGECGGPSRGQCAYNRCQCKTGWTGPHCLASVAFNDIDYNYPEVITPLWFNVPLPIVISCLGKSSIIIICNHSGCTIRY